MGDVNADGEFVVGRARPKNNPLIHRSEVGKPAFHNDLPTLPDGYTFGAPLKKDPEGAGDVMLTWQCHAPPSSKQEYDFGRDFVTLNKKSVQMHCVTPKDVQEFRHYTDARIKPNVTGKKPAIVPDRVKDDRQHSYGSKSGSSESVADLLQNRYELEWVMEQKNRQEQMESAQVREKARRAGRSSPVKSLQRKPVSDKPAASPHPRDFFTMSQFKNVPSRYTSPSPGPGPHH